MAEVYASGFVREDVMSLTVDSELEWDPERLGVAVLVRVNKIAEISGAILQER